MPNRVLREGLLTSFAWNNLIVEERDLYIRLLLVVDDFGCYDGRDEVIAAKCCPTFTQEQLNAHPIADMLKTLHAVGLIIRYSNRGKPFIGITQWASDYRNGRKFPA